MDGDVERLSFIYRDGPTDKTVTLSRAQVTEPTQLEAMDLRMSLDKIRANDPEVVRGISHPVIDREQGRLAVSLAVYGSHETLHAKAAAWVEQFDDQPLERRWSITH